MAGPAKPEVRLLWETGEGGRCRPGETFGASGLDSIWVSDQCEGVFRVTSAAGGERSTVECRPELYLETGYDQTVETRRWWCLWMCRRGQEDRDGLYHCRVQQSALDLVRDFTVGAYELAAASFEPAPASAKAAGGPGGSASGWGAWLGG